MIMYGVLEKLVAYEGPRVFDLQTYERVVWSGPPHIPSIGVVPDQKIMHTMCCSPCSQPRSKSCLTFYLFKILDHSATDKSYARLTDLCCTSDYLPRCESDVILQVFTRCCTTSCTAGDTRSYRRAANIG